MQAKALLPSSWPLWQQRSVRPPHGGGWDPSQVSAWRFLCLFTKTYCSIKLP